MEKIIVGGADEIGRELFAQDLPAMDRKVVCSRKEDDAEHFTVWLEVLSEGLIILTAGEIRVSIILFIENGIIQDAKGRRIHLYEYLGKV